MTFEKVEPDSHASEVVGCLCMGAVEGLEEPSLLSLAIPMP